VVEAEALASKMKDQLSQDDILVTDVPEFRKKIEDLLEPESSKNINE
jgi:hypothetical protein